MNIILPENLLHREILDKIIPFFEEENILLLTGARQTGKTSLLYLLVKYLWKKGVVPSQTVYFDLENIHDLNKLDTLSDFNAFFNILKTSDVDLKKRIFVFIDEIQHLANPSAFLKYLHDHYKPGLKFIVTGSSSLEIKKKFTDRLTGRVYNFLVKPLNLREFTRFRGEKELYEVLCGIDFEGWLLKNKMETRVMEIEPSISGKLRDLVEDYLVFGGYPGVSLKEKNPVRIKDLQEIYSLYVRRDIRDLGEIADLSGYNKLVSLLGFQIGNLVKENELAISSGLSRPTVKKYLFLLENTYVVKLVPPFFTNKRKELIKIPKVFFEDIGIRNGVLNNFLPVDQRTDRGAILENFVFNQLSKQQEHPDSLRIWRTQNRNEVDFVWQGSFSEPCPIEVKSFYSPKQPLPPGLKNFISAYRPKRAFIVHHGEYQIQKFRDTTIYAIPAWAI
jgi:predicted AAA+ superfamily ATPase